MIFRSKKANLELILSIFFAGLLALMSARTALASQNQDIASAQDSPKEALETTTPSKELVTKNGWVFQQICAESKCEPMLSYDGAINSAAFDSFQLATRKLPRGTTILLNSTSGDLVSGIKLGKMIRQYGFNTRIGQAKPAQPNTEINGQCYSACVLAFAGGLNRYIDADDIVGINGLSLAPEAKEADYPGSMKALAIYFDQMGVDRRIIDLMLKAKAKGITKISLDTAKQLNLDNSPSNHAHLWRIGAISATEAPIGLVSEKQASGHYAITLGLTGLNKGYRLTIFIQPNATGANLKELVKFLSENSKISLISAKETIYPEPSKPWEIAGSGVITAVLVSEKELNQLVSALDFELGILANQTNQTNHYKLDKTTPFSTAGLKGVILALKK